MNDMTKHDQSKMIKHELSIRQWSEIIKERQISKQTVKAYCREHELSEGAYYYWQKVIREKACACITDIQQDPVFIPVSCETAHNVNSSLKRDAISSAVTLQIHDVRIELNDIVSIEQLSDIIKAVRASC